MTTPSVCPLAEPSSGEGKDMGTAINGCLRPHQGHIPPCPQGTLRGSLYFNLQS